MAAGDPLCLENANGFLAERLGLAPRERLAIAGAMLVAPLTAIASPLIGLGFAGAMVAPRLIEGAQRSRAERDGEPTSIERLLAEDSGLADADADADAPTDENDDAALVAARAEVEARDRLLRRSPPSSPSPIAPSPSSRTSLR